MKFIILILLSTPMLFAQKQTATLKTSRSKRPKSLKGLELKLKGSVQSNPGRVDQNLLRQGGLDTSTLESEILEVGAQSKWLFKPLKKFILLDTLSIQAQVHSDSAEERLPFQDRLELKNDLVGVYVVNRKNQIGNLLRTQLIRGNSFQISDRPGIQELNQDHFLIQNVAFYQRKINQTYTTRFDIGARIMEFTSDYSSFTGAEGEQDDNLAGIFAWEHKFKISKKVSLKVPLSYRRELYKNRIALTTQGAFNTSGSIRDRDDLEVFEIGPELEIRFQSFQLSASLTQVQQSDQISGGRDYQGYRGALEVRTAIDHVQLKADLQFNDFNYRSARVLPNDPNSELWVDQGYGLGAEAIVPINEKLHLSLSGQKQVAEDNFFAGRFDNDIYRIGLEYNL